MRTQPNEPLAIRIAEGLLVKHSEAALGCARDMRDRAWSAGQVAHADLYTAVCSVLMWRDQVVGRPPKPSWDG